MTKEKLGSIEVGLIRKKKWRSNHAKRFFRNINEKAKVTPYQGKRITVLVEPED